MAPIRERGLLSAVRASLVRRMFLARQNEWPESLDRQGSEGRNQLETQPLAMGSKPMRASDEYFGETARLLKRRWSRGCQPRHPQEPHLA